MSKRKIERPAPPLGRPSLIALSVMSALSALPAMAQNSATTPQAEKDFATLDPVTVTATRRAESLQSVPIAVSVVEGFELEQANLNNLESIIKRVPSADFRSNSSNKDTSLFVRGVGTITTSPGAEPTVSTVIDGVVLSHPGQASLDLLDVDRIEVLRGPQGTLFGKNASAGVINIVTQEPSSELHRYVDVSYYQGNEKRVRAGISGELSSGVAWGSLTGLYGDYGGNVKNVYNGETVNGYDKAGARGKLVLKPSADLKITLNADYLQSTGTNTFTVAAGQTQAFPTGATTRASAATLTALSPVTPSATNRQINSDYKTYVDDTNWGLSGQVDWNIGAYTLTSITAFRRWNNTQYQDGDGLPLALTYDKGTVALDQVSQEVRLASPKGGFFDYVTGVFYQHTKDDETYQRHTNPGGNYGIANYSVSNTNYSVFGEGRFNFTPRARLISGLRLTETNLDYQHQRVSNQVADVSGIRASTRSSGSTTDTGYSGRIGPQFDLTENISTYATYSRGYKGPAYNVFYNMRSLDTTPLKPETSDSYEVGLKSESFNKRLRLNIAAFSTKYDNYQANLVDLVGGVAVTRLINAGEVSTKGVEVDFTAKPSSQLTLSGAVANTRARVEKFSCPTGAVSNCLLNGQPLPFAPDWRANLRADYRIPVADGRIVELSTDYRWQSEVQYQLTETPDTIQKAYGIVNGSVALNDPAKGWRVALVGKNLTNKSYSTYLAQGNGTLQRWVPRDDERYFGINVRQDF
jgi:iron complex outermembrane recepter protein